MVEGLVIQTYDPSNDLIAHRLTIQHQPAPVLGLMHQQEDLEPDTAIVKAQRLDSEILLPITGIKLNSRKLTHVWSWAPLRRIVAMLARSPG